MKKYAAIAGLIASVYFIAFHTDRFLQDFWPLDASRVAPNILAALVQYIILGVGLYLLYPPFRKAIDRWMRGHLQAGHEELHAKLDHIIHHSKDIPDFGTPVTPPHDAAAADPGHTTPPDDRGSTGGTTSTPPSGSPSS